MCVSAVAPATFTVQGFISRFSLICTFASFWPSIVPGPTTITLISGLSLFVLDEGSSHQQQASKLTVMSVAPVSFSSAGV